ncbi:MAG: hypothetical protein ACJARE_003847, partial [Paracoccaceae bacterium]
MARIGRLRDTGGGFFVRADMAGEGRSLPLHPPPCGAGWRGE